MKKRAYLIIGDKSDAVTLEYASATDYASKHRGIIMPLVSELDAKAFAETILQLAENGNLDLIIKGCKEQIR
jgi:hypothetical protein